MPSAVDPASLAGGWTHSHEEDQGGLQVFRRSSYAFPRSRGRASYELKPDGALGGSHPGPDDRTVPTAGNWRLEDGKLTVSPEGGQPIRYQVQSVDADRLVVKPITDPQ